jgi:hypothetical protein
MAIQRKSSGRPGSALQSAGEQPDETQGNGPEPDVILDVPRLAVDEIALEVDNLHARIALEARLADLVELRVGADVEIERVALEIKGVEAEAHLRARLDRVLAIIERALDTVDKNPQILTELAQSAGRAAGSLGNGVAQIGEEAGQLAEGSAQQAGQLVEGAAQATGSSSEGRRRRSGSDGTEKPDAGAKRRKADPSRS